jgi:hypothetical protein
VRPGTGRNSSVWKRAAALGFAAALLAISGLLVKTSGAARPVARLKVCVQTIGSRENIGDLSVHRTFCKKGARIPTLYARAGDVVYLHGASRGALRPGSDAEHAVAGRWVDVRPPSARELNVTAVLALSIEQASAKTRYGPPSGDQDDYGPQTWAGVIPLRLVAGQPETDEHLRSGTAVPQNALEYECGRSA